MSNLIVDRLLRTAFLDYSLVPSQVKGEINVVNLKLNPEADAFSFLRGLPVVITAGTAAAATITGLSVTGFIGDVWKLYRTNQADLTIRVKVSDVLGMALHV
jgi:hypothetical protein